MKNLCEMQRNGWNIEINSCGTKTDNIAETTYRRMVDLATAGYRFVVGNHPQPTRTVYGCPVDKAVKIAQTNHRLHGKSIRTIWAVK